MHYVNIFSEGRGVVATFNQRGLDFFQKGKFLEALRYFDMAILCNAADDYAYSMRNFCYHEVILENREVIISLQQQISKNHELMDQLQKSQSNKSIKAFKSIALINQELALQLQSEIEKQDDLIRLLQCETSENKGYTQFLQSLNIENNEILQVLKTKFIEIQLELPSEIKPICHKETLSLEVMEKIIKDTMTASFDYHTADIEQRVRLVFLEAHSHNPTNAQYVTGPYREILMLEALDAILEEGENLSKVLDCKSVWFWDAVQRVFNEKNLGGIINQQINSFVKIKKSVNLAMG